jgi:hypothetical protein
MPAYRIYSEGDDGNFSSAPEFVECADDNEAVDRAMHGMNGHALEIGNTTVWSRSFHEALYGLIPPQLAASRIPAY